MSDTIKSASIRIVPPAQVAKMFGCTEEQARNQITPNA